MAGRPLPGLGLTGFWLLGEDGWNAENDTNLLVLSALVQPRVLDIVSATPGAPADGQIYFFDDTHPTDANKVAIRDNGAWAYIAAFPGMSVYNVAEDCWYRFDGASLLVVPNHVQIDQAAYDALAVKDPNTLYYIPEP